MLSSHLCYPAEFRCFSLWVQFTLLYFPLPAVTLGSCLSYSGSPEPASPPTCGTMQDYDSRTLSDSAPVYKPLPRLIPCGKCRRASQVPQSSLCAHAAFLDPDDAPGFAATITRAIAFPWHLFSVPAERGRLIVIHYQFRGSFTRPVHLFHTCSVPSDLSYSRVLHYRAPAGLHGRDFHPFDNIGEFQLLASPLAWGLVPDAICGWYKGTARRLSYPRNNVSAICGA